MKQQETEKERNWQREDQTEQEQDAEEEEEEERVDGILSWIFNGTSAVWKMSMTREEKEKQKRIQRERSTHPYSTHPYCQMRREDETYKEEEKYVRRLYTECIFYAIWTKSIFSPREFSLLSFLLLLDDSERQETVLCQFKTSYTIKKKKQQKKTQLAFIGHRDFFLFFSETESQVMFWQMNVSMM